VTAWRIERPLPLGAVETVLKLPAVVMGIVVLVRALGDDVSFPEGSRLAQWVMMVVLCVGLVAAVGDRLTEREVGAMAFIGPNLAAHLGVLVGLMTDGALGDLLVPCLGLYLVGDGVKLVAIGTGELRVDRASPAVLAALTGVYVAGYLAILLIDGVR
jgi:hypothetical protein